MKKIHAYVLGFFVGFCLISLISNYTIFNDSNATHDVTRRILQTSQIAPLVTQPPTDRKSTATPIPVPDEKNNPFESQPYQPNYQEQADPEKNENQPRENSEDQGTDDQENEDQDNPAENTEDNQPWLKMDDGNGPIENLLLTDMKKDPTGAAWLDGIAEIYSEVSDFDDFMTWNTKYECKALDFENSFCVYENVCYDGAQIYFLNSSLAINRAPIELDGPEENVEWNQYLAYHNGFGIIPSYAPILTKYTQNITQLSPKRIVGRSLTVEITDKVLYITPGEMKFDKVMPLDELLSNIVTLYQLTHDRRFQLPPADVIIYPAKVDNYQREFIRKFIPSNSQVGDINWVRGGYKRPDPPIENFDPEPRMDAKNMISNKLKHHICTKRALVYSANYEIFNSYPSYLIWKSQLRTGLPITKTVTNKIVVINNTTQWDNMDEVIELLNYYKLNVKIRNEPVVNGTLEEYLKDFQGVDIHIFDKTINSNADFLLLPKGVGNIEIYPFARRSIYHRSLCNTFKINYEAVESSILPSNVTIPNNEFSHTCLLGSRYASPVADCSYIFGKASRSIHVPIADLEKALISMYEMMGININLWVDQLFSTTREFTPNDYHLFSNLIADESVDLGTEENIDEQNL